MEDVNVAGGEGVDVETAAPAVDPDWGTRSTTLSTTARLVLHTSVGRLAFAPNVDDAPRSVTAFVELADTGFFAGSAFHRLVPGFVLQGGCPRGDGTGDAGAGFDGEVPLEPFYPRGALALAGRSERGSHSSQFFIVLEDLDSLPPDYPILGTLVEGEDLLDELAAWDVDDDERPVPAITLESVSLVR